ncbi:MAG TPA: Ig-like domain-containing protein [Actinocrinis sp.]|nr:Ig-like domain-containing protein [Actinocrinis sp.]
MAQLSGMTRRRAILGAAMAAPVFTALVAGFAAAGSAAASVVAGAGAKVGTGGGPTKGAAATPSATPTPVHYPPASVNLVPADGAANVDPSIPVTVTAANGTVTSVQLSGGSAGDETSGTMAAANTTWTSNGTLDIDTSYQLQVQVLGKDGKTVTATSSFSTLKPSSSLGVDSMWPDDGSTVGVGQPIRIRFNNSVSPEYRAGVEKACVVTTTPAVAGAWYWADDDMMDWRPNDFWAVNTKVSVALNLEGVRSGSSRFGVKNHSLAFTVRDTDLRLVVDAKAFRATCYADGSDIRSWPIDTGKPGETFVTWQGTFSVLGKGNPVEMKGNYGPGDTYDDEVAWATQITYSGTYVHAAPWDGGIGHANDDSHGCIHCRTGDAEWFYDQAHVGDVVQVTGTNKTVAVTNGLCDWTLPWAQWLAGSAYGATMNGTPV